MVLAVSISTATSTPLARLARLAAHPTNPGRRADPTAWRSHTDHWAP